MGKYVFAYHGGSTPESEEQVAKVMAAWRDWMGGLGDALVDPGNPFGEVRTVTADGVTVGGGANPNTGYSILMADSLDAAVAAAKGCPILDDGGSIEVAEAHEM